MKKKIISFMHSYHYLLIGEYDGVKAFSCISHTIVSFVLAMFSALLIHASFNNHRQFAMPWLWSTMLIACTRDIYMLIRSFFVASTGSLLGILYVAAMGLQISTFIYQISCRIITIFKKNYFASYFF